MRHISKLVCSLLILTACSSEGPAADGAVLFEGARLIIGDRSATIEDSAFVVENKKFTQVGRKGEIQLPKGAVRIDLTGKTVMPAMIDGHAHPGYINWKTGESSFDTYSRETLIDDLYRNAYYGVGMLVSLGNDGGHGDLPWKLQEEEIPDAARFRTVGPGISVTGGGQGGPRKGSWTAVTTTAEARKAVQELVPHKPDFVKIWVDDRADRLPKPIPSMSPELYGAVIDEAHKHDLRVVAHITYLEDAKQLLKAGVDGFAHMVRDIDHPIDDEFIGMLKERQVFFQTLIPALCVCLEGDIYTPLDYDFIGETMVPSRINRLRTAWEEGTRASQPGYVVPRGMIERGPRLRAIHLINIGLLVDSGLIRSGAVTIGMGSDAGTGWAAHTELEEMVGAGMTPAEAIIAATGDNAKIFNQDKRVGTVASGKSADFIILDANPLDDITNTRKINQVYLRGKQVDRAALSKHLTAELASNLTSQIPEKLQTTALTPEQEQIQALEQRRLAAFDAGDVAALRELLADDYIHVHSLARMDDRETYLVAVEKYPRRTERGPLTIRVYGDMAVVTGEQRNTLVKPIPGISPPPPAMSTQVAVRQNGKWRFVSTQNTRVMQSGDYTPKLSPPEDMTKLKQEPLTAEQKELVALDALRAEAIANNDFETLAKMMSDDYIHVMGSGKIKDRAAYIKQFEGAPRSYTRGPVTVRLYGDAAVMTGWLFNTLKLPNQPEMTAQVMVTQVAHRVNGQWQFVSQHMTPKLELPMPKQDAPEG